MGSVADTIAQLNAARAIVLADAALYPQVVPGVLPVIAPAASLPLRRWGADFLAETFASPVLNGELKQQMIANTPLLDTIRGYISRKEEMGQAEDPAVVKSAVQCAASIYPLAFREAISIPTESEVWTKMLAIKSSILRQMDYLPSGVRICCIKFLAVVVQIQTAGLIADPRRPEQNEISLAMLNRSHAVLQVGTLEAEASGLLDRLLSTLQEENDNALLVTATINALSPLVHRRASISAKIISAILNFNPLRSANRSRSPVQRVHIKSMTRTTCSFLMNILKRNPQHNLAPRIQQHIDRLRHTLIEAFSDNALKRPAPDEPTDGLDDAKRQRIEQSNGLATQRIPPLPPGPVTAAQLFTLTNDTIAANFDVSALPQPIVIQLVPALIAAIDKPNFDHAINAIRARYLEVTSRPPPASATEAARRTVGFEEDDDYDPSADFAGDAEQAMNQLEGRASFQQDQNIQITHFNLPQPAPLKSEEVREESKMSVVRLFSTIAARDREAKKEADAVKPVEASRGFNRNIDPSTREGFMQLVVRMCTRTGLDIDGDDPVKIENGVLSKLAKPNGSFDLLEAMKNAIFTYVMEDFRRRINDIILWFNEEWYVEMVAKRERGDVDPITQNHDESMSKYTYWTLRFLDAIVPYLDVKDNRILTRFFSEIPALDSRHLDRLVKVADDPERVNLAIMTLLYLIMLRPPVREIALDAMESLWKNNPDAKKSAEKHLLKWRPDVVAAAHAAKAEEEVKEEA